MKEAWLPWAALVVGIVALVLGKSAPEAVTDKKVGKSAHTAGGMTILLGLVALGAGFALESQTKGMTFAGQGVLAGCLLSTALGFLGSRFDPAHANRIPPIAFGVAAVSCGLMLPPDSQSLTLLGFAAGAGIGAFVLGLAPTPWPATLSVTALSALALPIVAKTEDPQTAGLVSALAVCVVALIARIGFGNNEKARVWSWVVAGAAGAIAVWRGGPALGWPEPHSQLAALSLGAGTVAVLVADMIEDSLGASILTAIAALGMATAAFSWLGSAGLALSLICATAMPLIAGKSASIGALSAMGGLVAMRVWKAQEGVSLDSFDIAQHYGLMGLLIGLFVSLAACQWLLRIQSRSSHQTVFAAALGAIALVAAANGLTAAISERGQLGMAIGLALGGGVAGLARVDGLRASGIGYGAAALLMISYHHMKTFEGLSRDDRIKVLAAHALAAALAVGLMAWLSRTSEEQSADSPTQTA